ncbi:MAG: cysteine desulfurase family protein [Parachlamydiaceae bacterium]|nr:cysteine desulfurase family protein [Parachlamydiaceae bacterium]
MTSPIYLDNSTTTRPSEKAVSAMIPYWTTYWGLPSSPHQKGQELYPLLTDSFKTLYQFLGADEEDQLVLTSSGTEAINHVISSVYKDITLSTGKNHFLSGNMDEAASILSIGQLEMHGCVGKMIEVDSHGIITPQALIGRLSPRTALLSLSWGNGLTGVIQPLKEIAELCRQRGVKLHVDATHVLGKLYIDLKEIDPDFLTFNGEQLHAPRGSGILYIKKGVKCSPFIYGSADQGGMRAGGLNVASLAGLAVAVQEASEHCDFFCMEAARLRTQFENGILQIIPSAQICFKEIERLPHCSTIVFPGIANEALLFALNRRGVYASIGGGNFQQLGLMLVATGMNEMLAHSAISFSLSRFTTETEIKEAIDRITSTVLSLTRLSEHI